MSDWSTLARMAVFFAALALLVGGVALYERLAQINRRLAYLREYCDDLRRIVQPPRNPPPRSPVWMDTGYPNRWDDRG